MHEGRNYVFEKTSKELKEILASFGMDPTGLTASQMEDLIAKTLFKQNHPDQEFPEQYNPMLAKTVKISSPDYVRANFHPQDYYIQEKQDGMRSLLELNGNHLRMTSRNRSQKDFMFSEHQDNVLGFKGLQNPFKGKTVLDGELMSPTNSVKTFGGTITNTSLQAVVSLVNSPTDFSLKTQQQIGSLYYIAYDILYFDGENVQDFNYEDRVKLVDAAVDEILKYNPSAPIQALYTYTDYDDPWELFQEIIGKGGEGIMLKKRTGKYKQDYRSGDLLKLKGTNTYDGFITGFVEPKANSRLGQSHLIGGLLVSSYIDGKEQVIAAVAGLSLQEREQMSILDADGNLQLNPEYLGKVVELVGNGWSRTGRLVHPRILNWRDDRQKESCQMSSKDIQALTR